MKKSYIPNMFTFINLSCGILSILSLFNKDYTTSSIFILVAGLVDRYDGRIARYLNASSEVGRELNSLADLVSFGVAPAMLTYMLFDLNSFGPKGIFGIILLVLFPICGAFRLARYNISTFNGVYTGVPITIVGCFMALFALITYFTAPILVLAVIFMLLGSYLMISRLKLKKV